MSNVTPPADHAVRILVVDDQDVVCAALGALLATQPDFSVVGTAADGAAAVRLCNELRPDVVLMDVRMPGVDGIAATRKIVMASDDQRPRVLILTTFDLDEHVYDALRAGASGFLLKDVTAEHLFDAVRIVAAGDALLAPTVTRRLITEFARMPSRLPPAAVGLDRLTPRETDVLQLVAEGMSNPEIATRLVISEETVKTHVSRMLSKLGLRDRTQAVVLAYESGLVTPSVHG
jgi:DNA-binding NarL/FixJ family response regulator